MRCVWCRLLTMAVTAVCATAPVLANTIDGPSASDRIRALRQLPEPMVPAAGEPVETEDTILLAALEEYFAAQSTPRRAPLDRFLVEHPGSRWRPVLAANIGLDEKRRGYWSAALESLRQSWQENKDLTEPRGLKQIIERAGAERLDLLAKLGRRDDLALALEDFASRPLTGSATELVSGARQGLWMMDHDPGRAYLCGPMALGRLRAISDPAEAFHPLLTGFRSGKSGVALSEVAALAGQLAMPQAPVYWVNWQGIIPTPSVIHWGVNHYAALIEYRDGFYRVEDPTFGDPRWMSRDAVEAEASGYFLIDASAVAGDFRAVPAGEAATVFGRGYTTTNDPDATTPDDEKEPDKAPCKGLATYGVHSMLVSLNIVDVPLGYRPPRGPSVNFRVTYNQREANQPAEFNYSNLGPKWTFDWLSFVRQQVAVFAPPIPGFPAPVLVVADGVAVPGGGFEDGYASGIDRKSHAGLVEVGTDCYERILDDGTRQIFDLFDIPMSAIPPTAQLVERKLFLTKIVDPAGNALTFAYDDDFRLVSATDSLGRVTTLHYDLPGDPLKITRVADPFGRSAHFEYDAMGRLAAIRDVIGIESRMSYDGATDFIEELTTPYGTTRFSVGEEGVRRWIEVTDAAGDKERVEFRHDAPGIASTAAAAEAVSGVPTLNDFLQARNTFYWDKQAMARHGADYTKAKITHWLHTDNVNIAAGIPESVKRPLENRVWYGYPGNGSVPHLQGSSDRPTGIARKLDDGSEQIAQFEYNTRGKATKAIDPLGRETSLTYAANGIDLIESRQTTGATNDLLLSVSWNSGVPHRPAAVTDAAGQTITFTYNAFGQVLTATNPEHEATTCTYDRDDDSDGKSDGYLVSVAGPVPGALTTFIYDAFGRVRTVTNSEGYAVTTDYDALDRPTRTTYPDGTCEEIVWNRLDPGWTRDRLGRWSQRDYNHLRQVVGISDPLGRQTSFLWCRCGDLKKLTDPMGRVTEWVRDLQGRVTSKIHPDGSHVDFTYEPASGRPATRTDARGQTTTFSYFLDDAVESVAYSNTLEPTPGVVHTYDPVFGRTLTRSDGAGTTTYTYHPVGSMGAGLVHTIDGPLAADTVTYLYDKLGRLASRQIDGASNESSLTYDALGRTATLTNPLGAFTFGYVNQTGRLAHAGHPNGMRSEFSYAALPADPNLLRIRHIDPSQTPISQFDYLHAATGRIDTWTIDQGAGAKALSLRYDAADQLRGASVNAGAGSPIDAMAWSFDAAGNRIGAQEGTAVKTWSVNTLNQFTNETAGGAVTIRGSVSEAADVAIDGAPATLNPDLTFEGRTEVQPGANTISVTATDGSDNTVAKQYQFTADPGAGRSFAHDADGSMTSDGARTFAWDAEDQLVRITHGDGTKSEFGYDGLGRRVRITEKDAAGAVTSDHNYVWDGLGLAEERDAASGNVTARYFPQGFSIFDIPTASFQSFLYTRDHLGSVREATDAAGAVVARYDYSPWGERTKLAGTVDSPEGFTGHLHHRPSGLLLAPYRAYNPALGRWISRDPIGEDGGINLYGYVFNNPTNLTDPTGEFVPLLAAWAAVEIGLSAWDAYDTTRTVLDPCATTNEKLLAGGLFAAGLALPGGGYSQIDNLAKAATKTGVGTKTAIVIGEGMDSIKAAAYGLRSEGVNAKWYQAWSKNFKPESFNLEKALQRNERWIKSKIDDGFDIYDIGIDPTRARRSPFYDLEKEIIEKSPVTPIPLLRPPSG